MISQVLDQRLEVRLADTADRSPIQRMLELYQHDLSHIWDQDLDARGEYGYDLDRYWSSSDCHAFVITVAGHYAGFALVDRAAKIAADAHWMDQFFVLKKYRGRGIGRHLAQNVFASLTGRWEVGQMSSNREAQAFWRSVISACGAEEFDEHEVSSARWQGMVQCFRIGASDS